MKSPELIEYIDKLFWILLIYVGGQVSNQIKKMRDSVEKLNVRMAEVLANLANHEKRIDRHQEEIDELKELKAKIHALS